MHTLRDISRLRASPTSLAETVAPIATVVIAAEQRLKLLCQ
jgi:hypothetical protein